jgi:steroid delta-isomerase
MPAQQLPQAVQDYFAAVKAMDAAAFAAIFAEDGVLEDPVGTPPNTSQAAIQQFFTGITAAFSAVELVPDDIYLAGPSMAIKWTGHATAKNGKQATFAGIDVIDLDAAGKIQCVRAFWDPGTLMAQIQ